MRSSDLNTCAVVLAATISTSALSQGTTGSTGSTTAATPTTTTSEVRRDSGRGFDWGWLGLLGLAGLLGLRRHEAPRADMMRSTAQR